ncbi:hypothetical protein CI610_03133 [invertebrate metagenome]|uniref:Uncharacterized protein n=1 Tax=invertebrate metagenome TaxID=1711999 RepID=A0A2H9T3X7_9ZZZZ
MTMRKIINAAGWTAAKPKYCHQDTNKVKRRNFCDELIMTNEQFNGVIFTDESTIQLHDIKQCTIDQLME